MFTIDYNDIKLNCRYEWSGEDYYFRVFINDKFLCFYDIDIDNYEEDDIDVTAIIKNEIETLLSNVPDFINIFLPECI